MNFVWRNRATKFDLLPWQSLRVVELHFRFHFFLFAIYLIFYSMIDRKEKIKWRGDLKETTGLIVGQVSSLKNRNRS